MGIVGQRFVISGAATARLAARKGAKVCFADINVEVGEAVAESIRRAGGESWLIRCDVTDNRQLVTLMESAASYMGGIDVIHNNAGVVDSMFDDKAAISAETFDRAVWDRVIAVNLTASMFAAKASVRYLKKSANPSIINAASMASFVGAPSALAYGSSKGGIVLLTKNLAVELAPCGIRSIATAPVSSTPHSWNDIGAMCPTRTNWCAILPVRISCCVSAIRRRSLSSFASWLGMSPGLSTE
jgi:NAD(P)-dependent dehydrogenase (short-subunit alcohol dehydrogenase family)